MVTSHTDDPPLLDVPGAGIECLLPPRAARGDLVASHGRWVVDQDIDVRHDSGSGRPARL